MLGERRDVSTEPLGVTRCPDRRDVVGHEVVEVRRHPERPLPIGELPIRQFRERAAQCPRDHAIEAVVTSTNIVEPRGGQAFDQTRPDSTAGHHLALGQRPHVDAHDPPRAGPRGRVGLRAHATGEEELTGSAVVVDGTLDSAEHFGDRLPLVDEQRSASRAAARHLDRHGRSRRRQRHRVGRPVLRGGHQWSSSQRARGPVTMTAPNAAIASSITPSARRGRYGGTAEDMAAHYTFHAVLATCFTRVSVLLSRTHEYTSNAAATSRFSASRRGRRRRCGRCWVRPGGHHTPTAPTSRRPRAHPPNDPHRSIVADHTRPKTGTVDRVGCR